MSTVATLGLLIHSDLTSYYTPYRICKQGVVATLHQLASYNLTTYHRPMYLTIDIGGTKTLLGRMKPNGTLEESLKFPTPHTYKEFKKILAESIDKITTGSWKLACVAAPGKINHKTGVAEAFGNLPWIDAPIKNDVSKLTDCPVLLENDTKLAGLSEARQLATPRHKTLYVTISTGIGTALITNNTIDPDLQDSEAGFMLFERDGSLQTWQSFASGKAIVRRFGKMASEINDPAIWQVISRDIAVGLMDVIANIQPDIIIIGGGVGSHFAKYEKFLRKELKKYENPLVPIPPIIAAKHPEEAVIYGCYELIKDYEKAKSA
jgi:predicted NBD/HSP70 family sugar kinase